MLTREHTKAIVKLMHTAKLHIDWPKMRLQLDDVKIQLSIAGKKAKVPGSLNITDGKSYPNNQFYGRIYENGTIEWSQSTKKKKQLIIHDLFELFADNPMEYAKLYADATSNCMFCSRDLTDPQSVIVGYGPICAGHYGLPHGEIKNEIANDLVQIEMEMPDIKLPLHSITDNDDNDKLPFFDITAPKHEVQIEIRKDQSVIWVSVDGQTVLRVCRISKLTVENRGK